MIVKQVKSLPRLPLEGNIDLTYRCNNNCVHCWVVEPDTSDVRRSELFTKEWLNLINQARTMGTREWAISGGEPLLRKDFAEIFSYISGKSSYCSLNTNGTLLTPAIAKLLRNTCSVMVSVYGADAEVNDRVTRNPGSFDAALAGISYLKEAGVRFMVQIVPMKENFHQWDEMKALAQRLSPSWRLGASALILSASGDRLRNKKIQHQRLSPEDLIRIDPPNIPNQERLIPAPGLRSADGTRTYAHCLSDNRAFHVDPSGTMGFCCYLREKDLRYNLRTGTLREGWEEFLPGLADMEQRHILFDPNCLSCKLRIDCQKCPGQAHLENRYATEPSSYFCQLQKAKHRFELDWKIHHRRFFRIAGITVEVNSPLPFKNDTFAPAVNRFAVRAPGPDMIQLENFFTLPEIGEKTLGNLVYEQRPWMIYRKGGTWSYVGYVEQDGARRITQVAVFSEQYSHGRLFIDSDRRFLRGNLNSLAMVTTDQIWLAHALLLRGAFYVHSSAFAVNGNGLLFVGHSRAGKTTIAKMFADRAEVLCDDRNIVRLWPGAGWRIHGTWSHGEMEKVSPSSAPLKGIFFLEKAQENVLIPIEDPTEIRRRLVPCLVRPFVNPQWWEEIWPLIVKLTTAVPAHILRFDKSVAVIPLIQEMNLERAPKKARVSNEVGSDGLV